MITAYDIETSDEFYRELLLILDYINFDLDNHLAAVSLHDSIAKTINDLTTFPLRFQIFKDNIRKVNIKNYCIYYSVDEQLRIVNILHILYQGRDISQIVNW